MNGNRTRMTNTASLPARSIALLVAAALVLGACSGLRQTFGGGKQAPDEFTVVRKAPLTLPPDFNLRPPQPGATPLQTTNTSEQAQAVVVSSGDTAAPARAPTAGEQTFLRQAGVVRGESNIRQVLLSETTQLAERDEGFIDRLIFWRNDEDGDVINPIEESRRVREQQLAGEARTQSPVQPAAAPTIRRRSRSLIGNIF